MELARVEDAPQQHVQMFTNRKTATKSARLSYMMEETERRTNRARKKSQKEWNKNPPQKSDLKMKICECDIFKRS